MGCQLCCYRQGLDGLVGDEGNFPIDLPLPSHVGVPAGGANCALAESQTGLAANRGGGGSNSSITTTFKGPNPKSKSAARMLSAFELLRSAFMYIVVPVWLIAGLSDYFCHRASHIELTSGPKESLLHVAQLTEVGVPLLTVLFLEVNAAVILLLIAGVALHQVTAILDVRYANATRVVSPAEQHFHSVLEMVPFFVILIVTVMHWPAVLSLFGEQPATFAPVLKQPPLPGWYLTSVLVAVVLFAIVPYGEELIRTLRQHQSAH